MVKQVGNSVHTSDPKTKKLTGRVSLDGKKAPKTSEAPKPVLVENVSPKEDKQDHWIVLESLGDLRIDDIVRVEFEFADEPRFRRKIGHLKEGIYGELLLDGRTIRESDGTQGYKVHEVTAFREGKPAKRRKPASKLPYGPYSEIVEIVIKQMKSLKEKQYSKLIHNLSQIEKHEESDACKRMQDIGEEYPDLVKQYKAAMADIYAMQGGFIPGTIGLASDVIKATIFRAELSRKEYSAIAGEWGKVMGKITN
jgi:hypothetical protein